jgi:hypothetical protein
MKKQSLRAIILAIITILLITVVLFSYRWYNEERVEDAEVEDGEYKSDLAYSLRGVRNETRLVVNGTRIASEEKVQDYDDFIGLQDSEAGQVASRMNLLMVISLVLAILFIPLVYLSSEGTLEDKVGKIGSYLPLICGQIAVLLLIISPMWFSYAFIMGLTADMEVLDEGPPQALGDNAGLWVIFGGVLLQFGVMNAMARTKLIFIEPPKGRTKKT